ncbi:MAG TPA: hypothetical protein VKM94_06640 [Blastocatellia bacterium]|nr:hypothetical protein [Blastocatellia bacterium]
MQTPKTAKSFGAHSDALQVGEYDPPGVAYDYVFDVAASIYKYAHLPVHLARDFGELTSKFVSDDLAWRDAPFVEFLEPVNLVLF